METLGFKVPTAPHMRFMRCNRKHHALAYAKSDLASLNHIAFEMRDMDAVMRGIGRLRDAGHELVWGPGRHGPGNNVFGYFVAPWGGIVEYTAEVSEVERTTRSARPRTGSGRPGASTTGASRRRTRPRPRRPRRCCASGLDAELRNQLRITRVLAAHVGGELLGRHRLGHVHGERLEALAHRSGAASLLDFRIDTGDDIRGVFAGA